MTRVMAIKKHSSSARTRERSCREGMRVRWRKDDEKLPHLLHPRVDLLVRGVDEEVALLVVLDECLHPEMNLGERIKAMMILQQVHLRRNCV